MDISAFCSEHLGSSVREVLFTARSLSVVTGVRLEDGREVVVKVRSPSARLYGCAAVQRALWPPDIPVRSRSWIRFPLTATPWPRAEAFVGGGVQLSGHPFRYAAELRRMVTLAPSVEDVPRLDPAPPWASWDHDRHGIWPVRDDGGRALSTDNVPHWLGDLACRAKVRLARCERPEVVGHCDWESQSLRWVGDRLHACHDWDSVAARPEPVIAGLAAAVYRADAKSRLRASVSEGAAFLDAYGLDGAISRSPGPPVYGSCASTRLRRRQHSGEVRASTRCEPTPENDLSEPTPNRLEPAPRR